MLLPVTRTITTESDARRCLDAAAAADISLYAWSRANSVSASVLYRWRRKLERPIPGPVPRLVELCAAPPAPVKPAPVDPQRQPPGPLGTATSRSSARYSLAVNDVTIVLRDDFTDDTLSRLLRVVRAC